jgi:signal transduction histidine kinase
MEKYIHPDDWPVFFAEASKAYINKSAFDLEHRALKEDGGMIWAHSRGVPILNEGGDIIEWVAIVNDITHKKEYEMMQREMILKLCEAGEQKNDFISALSHELRNPLMAITMSISLMEQVNPGSEPDLHAREILQRQIAQMVRLIDDLMDITRINRDKLGLVKENIEVNASIKEIMDDFQAQFENKGLVLQEHYYDFPLYISADPARLKQVMGNLLSNSLKFTEKGGLVRVLIAADDETDEAFIRVADTGIGIAPELLPKLFEQFIQADNTPGRNAGGLGLGLSIVKGIIDLHGGSITVNSGGKGRGTEFLIRLPLLKQEK